MLHNRINDENSYVHHQAYKPVMQQRSAFDANNQHNAYLQPKQFNQVASKPVHNSSRVPLSNVTNNSIQQQQYQSAKPVQHQYQLQQQQQPQQFRYSVQQQVPSMSRAMHMSPESPVMQEAYLAKPEQFSNPRSPGMDKLFEDDPRYCSEYALEIYQHQKSIESRYMPSANYMARQTDLTPNMRSILVDWLVEVHDSFELMPDTLFLSINLIDRFLSTQEVGRTKLQLVGISALLIAAKYEEIHVPEVDEFLSVAANCYSREQLLDMERRILTVLDFNVTVSTPYPFLRRFLRCGKCDHRTHYLAYMLTELSHLVTEYLQFTPSIIASASIYLAQKFLGSAAAWDRNLQYYSGYSENDIKPCAQLLLGLVKMQLQESQKPKEKRV